MSGLQKGALTLSAPPSIKFCRENPSPRTAKLLTPPPLRSRRSRGTDRSRRDGDKARPRTIEDARSVSCRQNGGKWHLRAFEVTFMTRASARHTLEEISDISNGQIDLKALASLTNSLLSGSRFVKTASSMLLNNPLWAKFL